MHTCKTIAALLCVALLAQGARADSPGKDKKPDQRLEQLWADLASSDEGKSARALLALAANPRQSVPLLRERLRPVKVDARRVARLLEQLDSDSFQERESAHQELEYLGKYVKADLEKAVAGKASPEVKKRAQRLLKTIEEEDPRPPAAPALRGGAVSITNANGKLEITINGKKLDLTPRVIVKRGPLPSWQRAVRAVAVLEHIGTPEARQVLERLAGGESDAPPTRAAAEALKRLKK
jgi:hypothetical protein